jgi:HlyD family secretion protein
VREEPETRSEGVEPTVGAFSEPPEGHERRETEGVFIFREGRAVFTPVEVGIAGERYFEVVSGLSSRDRVVTGPFASVRGITDGETVRLSDSNTTERR